MTSKMKLSVNGKKVELDDAMSISALLQHFEYQSARTAVEQNGAVVPRAQHAETIIKEGDVIEIVTLVGGG